MNDKYMKHEQQAELLEQHLKDQAQRHDGVLLPFEQTADALNREATVSDQTLEANVARTQRGFLMQLAKKQKQAPQPVVAEKSAKSESKPVMRVASPWLAWIGGAATVIAVLFAAVFVQDVANKPGMSPATTKSAAAIARLVIPEVSAADAFSLVAETQDASGADPSTAFLMKSSLPLSAQDIQNHVRIIPASDADASAVEVTVDNISDGQFRIRPTQALQAGKVYTVAVDAAVKKADGEVQARDFTWAVQTKNVFRVLSSLPARDSSYVPVDTGIEFVMSMNGWEDPTEKFTIQPPTQGRFESRGRSLVFVPSKPLKPGQLYIVTLKKGLKLSESDRSLEKDEILRFETALETKENQNAWHLNVEQPFITVAPKKDILIPFWSYNNGPAPEITATGFSVSLEQAKELMKKEGEIPSFAEITRGRGEAFSAVAKTQAFQIKPTIERQDYQTFLKMPEVNPGLYVVKIEPKDSPTSWFFLQVTKVASYITSDKDTTLVWAMNTETNQPLQNNRVTDGVHSASTDAKGLARIPTAAELLPENETKPVIIQIGSDADIGLVRLMGGTFRPWDRWTVAQDDKTMSFVMTDRPLYHPTDIVEVFGKAIDRDTQKPSTNLTLELQRNGFFDWFVTGKEKAYRTVNLQTDEQGVFRAKLDWNQLQPGYYQIVLKRDGVFVRSRSIEIRDFVKPAYLIEVLPMRKAVMSGEKVKVDIRARFFEGTPVSGLVLGWSASGAIKNGNGNITTDADGSASIELDAKVHDCYVTPGNSYCPEIENLDIAVRPVSSEDAEIMGGASVSVWRSRIHLETEIKNSDSVAAVTITARSIDLAKAEQLQGSADVLSDPKRSQKITGRVIESTWEKRESGTSYDFIEKKVVPMYSYEQKYRDIAPIDILTDSQGKATINVPMSQNASYIAIFSTKDESGREQYATAYVWRDGYNTNYPSDTDIRLDAVSNQQNQSGYNLGQQAVFELTKGSGRLPDADTQSILFMKAIRGIKDVQVGNSAVYRFNYAEQDIPNVVIRGVLFKNGGFIERQSSATYNATERQLKLKLETDATSYAPGAKARVHITAVDPQGKPAKAARTVIAFVDEALFAAANTTGEEDPLGNLYSWVSDGIIVRVESHLADAAEMMRMGGAEMGGGGNGEGVRRNFKDTAAVKTVILDENGQGDIELDLPDNLTTWRATAVALSGDLKAGTAQTSVPVSKRVFVEAVVPETVLQNDKPVLKLRAYGSGLKQGEKVQYAIDAPTLGLKQEFDGIVGTPTYISIDRLTQGEHAMVLRLNSSAGKDALEKKIRIVPSRFLRTEAAHTELAPAVSLPDIGESREIDLQVLPKTRAQYLDRVEGLSYGWSGRVESQVAANIARNLLTQQFAAKNVEQNQSVAKYQKASGGIAILPYASEDTELSAKIAAIAPDQFDRAALGKYFFEILKRPEVTREQQIRAISGLASLGEPVLPELRTMAEQKELNWREQLALARAATAIGDQQTAGAMLAPFFARMEEQDGKSFIRVSEDKREQIEATAEMAVVAAKLHMPQASRLDAWLQTNWAMDAFTDLDRIAYLQTVVPAALGRDLKMVYTIGSGNVELKIENGRPEMLTLTAEEAKNFRVVSIDGPAVGVFTRWVASPITTSHKDVGITRTITTADDKNVTAAVKEGDQIMITLQPSFSPSAPSGCYLLRDHLPAGLSPLVTLSFAEYKQVGSWYPQNVERNTISYTVCNRQDNKPVEPISYRARVTARGTYLAEPAILQSYDSPSVSAVTGSTTLEIK